MTKRLKVLLGAGVVVVLLIGFAGWWFLIRDDAPAAVSLDDARETVDGEDGAGSGPSSVTDVSGVWTVDPSVGSFDDFSGSFVGYRVEEELSTIGSNTAVGRTPDVTGELTIDGTDLTEVTVTADLTGLESDEGFRDGSAQRALGTDEFPEAVFATTEAVDLGADPGEGSTVTTSAAGELTLHGVTQPVTVDLEAELIDGVIVVTGSTSIDMTEFGITPPVLGPVVTISDQGEIEVQLFFAKS
jgi:polyisoprenoid-binding protein YceI